MKVYAIIKTVGSSDYGFVTVSQPEILEMRIYRKLEKACDKINDIFVYVNCHLTDNYYEETTVHWEQKERTPGYGFVQKYESDDGNEYEWTSYYVEELEVE